MLDEHKVDLEEVRNQIENYPEYINESRQENEVALIDFVKFFRDDQAKQIAYKVVKPDPTDQKYQEEI
jgi:hypothetical protein